MVKVSVKLMNKVAALCDVIECVMDHSSVIYKTEKEIRENISKGLEYCGDESDLSEFSIDTLRKWKMKLNEVEQSFVINYENNEESDEAMWAFIEAKYGISKLISFLDKKIK